MNGKRLETVKLTFHQLILIVYLHNDPYHQVHVILVLAQEHGESFELKKVLFFLWKSHQFQDEEVNSYLKDQERLDLFIRLESDLLKRQKNIATGTGNYEYAQIRTMTVSRQDYKDRASDMLVNTDIINIEFIDSGKLRRFLKEGLMAALQTSSLRDPSLRDSLSGSTDQVRSAL